MHKLNQDSQPQQQTSYKQVSKLKHLTEEHTHLKSLVNILEQINHRSRVLLKQAQDKSKNIHLNSTACSFGSIGNDVGLMDQDITDIEQLVASLHLEIDNKKQEFEKKAAQQEKSKIEDQILFRKMLYEYQNKLTTIKGEIKLREQSIQEMQKQQKQGKVPVLQQKILGVFHSNFDLFGDMCFFRQQLEEIVTKTSKIEEQIKITQQEIKKLQQFTLKLRVAKKAKMPYYKFRNIMKHNLFSMENQDKQDYAALMQLTNDDQDLMRPMRSRVSGQNIISPQTLYLILRKQQMNKQLIHKMIRQQDKRQEQLLAQNQLLKQAIQLKQQQQYFKEIETGFQQNMYDNKIDDERLSQCLSPKKSRNCKNLTKLQLNATEYHIYLQKLHKKVQDLMLGYIPYGIKKKNLYQSRSQKLIRSVEEHVKEEQRDGTAKFISEDNIFDQYNNIITDRFYGEEPQYQFVE